MNYDAVNEHLMTRFPELTLLFKEQINLWGEENILPHCFYGDTLNYYVTELLRKNSDSQQIKKVFQFYEEMASSDDVEVRNLLQVTLLEYLWDEEIVFKNALENMQPKTRIINSEIGAYLKTPVASPGKTYETHT